MSRQRRPVEFCFHDVPIICAALKGNYSPTNNQGGLTLRLGYYVLGGSKKGPKAAALAQIEGEEDLGFTSQIHRCGNGILDQDFACRGFPSDAQLLRLLLGPAPQFSVVTATRVSRGIAYLSESHFDLVLLDLSLPDGDGIDTLRRVRCCSSQYSDRGSNWPRRRSSRDKALREGAQDYLIKGEIDRSLLVRVIRYACERNRLMADLHSLALMDTLTGLYNRRGFVTIAEEQLKLACRMGHSVALAFIDLDGMKKINDELGHEAGDQALFNTAGILRSTFRASDIIARLGGDEFIVLAIATRSGSVSRLHKRLRQTLARHNALQSPPTLSFSVGIAHYNPLTSDRTSIEHLMTRADQAMYVEKQSHRTSRTFQEQARANRDPENLAAARPGPEKPLIKTPRAACLTGGEQGAPGNRVGGPWH